MPADPRTAADVMTASPRTCSQFSTVMEAVMLFRDADCGLVPIVDDRSKPIGVLTDRDVALALTEFTDLPNRSVADIMSKDPITVLEGTPLDEVEAKLSDKAIRRLLVVDATGALTGIVTWADLASRESEARLGQVAADVLQTP